MCRLCIKLNVNGLSYSSQFFNNRYRLKQHLKIKIIISLTIISDLSSCDFFLFHTKTYTEDPRYNDTVCYQRFAVKSNLLLIIKKLDMDPSKA